ncbi:MAG: hypothetical protein QOE86_2143 [Solirubrobacteraceae bacterium]|nr:hypothetical protein [Solirubrobacteraceae bacterium]
MIHVYGITHANTALPGALEGLGQRPVRLVSQGELAAVVTDLDEPPRTRADLDSHAQVQGAIVAEATLVPLRFGTLLEDEGELREGLLGRHAGELRDVLASVDGRVQMTVKAVYHEGTMLREAVQAHPELKRESDRLSARNDREGDRDAWVRLGEHVAHIVEGRRLADEGAIVGALEPHAEQILVEEPGHERMAARLQLLVRRDRRAALDAAVAALGAEQEPRMTLRYVGPLAPYSFSDLALDGTAAWA